jgi:hypothetical protein
MTAATEAGAGQIALRHVIAANGWFSLVSGAIGVVAAAPIGDLMELLPSLLVVVGIALVGYGAALRAASRRRPFPRGVAWLATAGDLAWVAGAVVLVAIPGTMSGNGKALVAALSVAVAGFAVVQLCALAASQ